PPVRRANGLRFKRGGARTDAVQCVEHLDLDHCVGLSPPSLQIGACDSHETTLGVEPQCALCVNNGSVHAVTRKTVAGGQRSKRGGTPRDKSAAWCAQDGPIWGHHDVTYRLAVRESKRLELAIPIPSQVTAEEAQPNAFLRIGRKGRGLFRLWDWDVFSNTEI